MDNQLPLFSRRLREARLAASLSQGKLGLKADVDVDSDGAGARISQYEAGTHSPRFPTAQKIAKALNVPTSYFYEEDEVLANLVLSFSHLNSRDRKTILETVKKFSEKSKK